MSSEETIKLVSELLEINKKILSEHIHLSEYTRSLENRVHINSEELKKNTEAIQKLISRLN